MGGRHKQAGRSRAGRWPLVAGVFAVIGATVMTVATVRASNSHPAAHGSSASTTSSSAPGTSDSTGLSVPTGASSDQADAGTASSSATTTPPAQQVSFPQDKPAAKQGAGPCIQLRMVSSLENNDMMTAAIKAYEAMPRNVDGHCVTATTTPERTGVAAADAGTGFPAIAAAQKPALWIPDSPSWLSVARSKGGAAATIVPTAGQAFASSAVVVAMPQTIAAALNWVNKPPTWNQVFAAAADPNVFKKVGHPEWGTFQFGKTSPLVATTGLLGMVDEYGASSDSVGAVNAATMTSSVTVKNVKQDELSTSHYMATPEHFLWHARQADDAGNVAEFLSAAIVDEDGIWGYNRGLSSNDGITEQLLAPPKQKLVPIYPSDGVNVATDTAVPLGGSWVTADQRAAAADFTHFLGTVQGQKVARDQGFRDLNGVAGGGAAAVGNYAATLKTLPEPTSAVVKTVQQQFPNVRKRARVLFLMDVSGSMSAQISPGVTKLQAAQSAVTSALGYFAPDDQVGLAAFSNVPGQGMTPGMVSPVAPLGTSKPAFTSALGNLLLGTQTPLYSAVDTFAKQMAAGYNPNLINAVVLLSDGKNDTTDPGTLATLTTDLTNLHMAGTPVMVFTLAYGKDADTATLQAIAKATHAHYYDATDPTTISAVLGDLVTSF